MRFSFANESESMGLIREGEFDQTWKNSGKMNSINYS